MSILTKCMHCNALYHDAKSTASLRLTYCTAMCEALALGFTINDLIKRVNA